MHQDYILRMIQQMTGFLVRVLKLREEREFDEALAALGDAYGRMSGIPASLVHALGEDDLVAMLRAQGRLDPERCYALAELLREEGHVYEELDQAEEYLPRFRKALRLYLEAYDEYEGFAAPLEVTGLEEMIERVGDEPLPPGTRRRLVAYLTDTSRFDRAENVVLWSLESLAVDGELRREAVAFYEGLLRKSDEALIEGGLPREEVEMGLLNLQTPLPLRSNVC